MSTPGDVRVDGSRLVAQAVGSGGLYAPILIDWHPDRHSGSMKTNQPQTTPVRSQADMSTGNGNETSTENFDPFPTADSRNRPGSPWTARGESMSPTRATAASKSLTCLSRLWPPRIS